MAGEQASRRPRPVSMIPTALADYVPRLQAANDDLWRMRIVCHEFGLRWEDTPLSQRAALVEVEPEPISPP